MMKQTINKTTCDACGKVVEDNGATTFGGGPLDGWFEVHKIELGTMLMTDRSTTDWVFCSAQCMKDYF